MAFFLAGAEVTRTYLQGRRRRILPTEEFGEVFVLLLLNAGLVALVLHELNLHGFFVCLHVSGRSYIVL
jgi:hypothetical protein